MAQGKRWSHDELIIAMNLYCKLPFGQLDHRTPLIVDVADRLGRTPSSLSMKLCNFASLDPVQQARGIKGLAAASRSDQQVWREFHKNWQELAIQSETMVRKLMSKAPEEDAGRRDARKQAVKRKSVRINPPDVTQIKATVQVRRGQDFFRQAVLTSYSGCCCVTGNPVPELLVASHILPWSQYPKERMNPHNGLCLTATHDAAFDKGLITFDEDCRLMLSEYLKDFLPEESIKKSFATYDGKKMRLPEKFAPETVFLEIHRNEIFLG